MLPLTETAAKYYYGLKYEDEVLVTCKMTKLTVARCEFTYEVYKLPEKKLMTVGKTGHGFVNCEFVPINLKKLYPEIWNKNARPFGGLKYENSNPLTQRRLVTILNFLCLISWVM